MYFLLIKVLEVRFSAIYSMYSICQKKIHKYNFIILIEFQKKLRQKYNYLS